MTGTKSKVPYLGKEVIIIGTYSLEAPESVAPG